MFKTHSSHGKHKHKGSSVYHGKGRDDFSLMPSRSKEREFFSMSFSGKGHGSISSPGKGHGSMSSKRKEHDVPSMLFLGNECDVPLMSYLGKEHDVSSMSFPGREYDEHAFSLM